MDSTTWPAGVTARYLTAGGATVDITDRTIGDASFDITAGHSRIKARCTGCGDTEWYATPSVPGIHRRAQAHAEKCRAIPRPAN